MKKHIPKSLQIKHNNQVLKYLTPLSCHGDIIEPLSTVLKKYTDVQKYCPDGDNFKYYLWHTNNIIFSFAVGMKNIALKLPNSRTQECILDGAIKCASAGNEWYLFPYNTNKLEKWSKIAYEYAKK